MGDGCSCVGDPFPILYCCVVLCFESRLLMSKTEWEWKVRTP